MDTDSIFHELFRNHPMWLRELTGLPFADGCRASSLVLKQLEIRCDLLFEPASLDDPHRLVEFQLYHDHSIFNRVELAKQLVWRQLNPREDCRRRNFRPRRVEAHILFGSRSELPSSADEHPRIACLFLDELLADLEARHPHSPLAAALAPLNDPLAELEKEAATHYRRIRHEGVLEDDDRKVLSEIFLNLLLQRFKSKSLEEISQMIAELTPLHETRAGRELLEEGIEQGIERGIERGIEKGIEQGIEKGRAEGGRALVRRQLERKFPAAEARARPLLDELEEADLLAFGEALLFLATDEECLAWLEGRRR